MSDQDDHEDDTLDEPRERRTEGVRIIGAQEAAAAAGRPDVVRRRRGSEKRYGDRPDAPPASDLPRITISTTEHDDEPSRSGVSGPPVARPAGDHGTEPQWRTEDREAGGPDSYGHARVVREPSDEVSDGPEAPEEPVADEPEPYESEPYESEPYESEPYEPVPSEPAPYEPAPYEPAPYEPLSADPAPYEPAPAGPEEFQPAAEEPSVGSGSSGEDWGPFSSPAATPGEDPAGWEPVEPSAGGDDPVGGPSSIWEPEPLPWQSEAPGAAEVPSWPEAPVTGTAESAPGGFGDDGDDSFILPHWTEPPTGQVPKVVIDEEPDPDAVASYGTQPRWRDEGERSVVADFDDLVEAGPGFGALRRHEIEDDEQESDFFSDGPSTEGGFAVTEDDTGFLDEADLYDDDLGEDESHGDEVEATSRRRPAPGRRSRDGGEPPAGRGGGDRNLPVAIGVGLGLIAIGLLCFWAGPLPTALLATVVVTLCGTEYFSAVRSAGHNPASLLGIVAVAGVMFATFAAGLAAYPVVLGLLVIGGLLWFLWVAPGEGAMANLGLTLVGVLWVGVLGSFSTLFLGLGRSVEAASAEITSNPGIGVLIAAVIASVTHDVGAYFTGKYLGRTPLSAASPNKTQEGLAGGVIVSIVVTFVLVGLVGISPIGDDLARAFIFAVLCALVAPLGDLCESFIKRDLGIKDMGSVLPGHGGVLDRFDALLFVLPTAYFVTVLFEIWTVGAG